MKLTKMNQRSQTDPYVCLESPDLRPSRFMPSRPMFDWYGPLYQLLKISEDLSIEDISEALEDAAVKLELADNIDKLLCGITIHQLLKT
jgi:hypothetical protein